MSTIIQSIEKEQLRSVPRFDAGDRVRVHFRVVEGTRTRTQVFEGVVIKRQGSGARETFTVRKQSFGVGVERTFPLHSPKIEKLEVAARGDVRRAKLYDLRDRVGKAARVAERRWGIAEDVLDREEVGAVDVEGASQSEAESIAPEAEEGAEEGAASEQGATEPEAAVEAAEEEAEAGGAEAEEEAEGADAAPEAESESSDQASEEEAEPEGAVDDQAGGSEADAAEVEASKRDD